MQTDLDTFKRVLNVAPNYLIYNKSLTATEWAVNRFWEDPLANLPKKDPYQRLLTKRT